MMMSWMMMALAHNEKKMTMRVPRLSQPNERAQAIAWLKACRW